MSGGGDAITRQFDFSGIRLSLSGLVPALAGRLDEEWRGFAAAADAAPTLLEVDVAWSDGPYAAGEYAPKSMQADFADGHATFEMPEGTARVVGSRATLRLVRAAGEDRAFYTLLNLVRASLAHRLPSRGAALVHAAGLVVEERGWLLVGGSGAGKSTWARLGARSGARVISDDVVIVDREADGAFMVAAAPLGSSYRVEYRPGRWSLAAVLHPRHAADVEITTTPRVLAQARLVANLPFVTEALATDGRVARFVEELCARIPQRDFAFATDTDVATCLASVDLAGGA